MNFHKVLPAALLTALLVFLAPLAHAAGAEGFVKEKQAELVVMINKSKGPADDKKIEAAFDNVLDYDKLAQASLREFWNERTPAERSEFQAILTKLVRAAYRKNLKRIGGYDVEYKGATKTEGGELVKTVAKKRGDEREEPIAIDYVVAEAGGKHKIVDIVTEGSSLVGNYRNQFKRIIKKDGFAELIKRMKTKLEKGDVS
jgi:phospholipid transport system substrate-binding protein